MRSDVGTDRDLPPVHVIGLAATAMLPEHDAMLDELVFDVVHRALRECGMRKQDLGLSVIASMDAYDGRSISSGLTTSAAGGYLQDAFRVEGDSGQAVVAGVQAVASGDVDVVVAVGVHNPETSGNPARRAAFLEQLSNLAFEPLADRPVAMTASTVYGLHAVHSIARGAIDVPTLAAVAAEEISTGAGRPRSLRTAPVSADDVAVSPPVSGPLRDLMMPAQAAGAVAIVLASPARAGRSVGRHARITGVGQATGDHTWSGRWLTEPEQTTRRAAAAAYRLAGVLDPATQLDVAEFSAPTPALVEPYVDALGLASADTIRNPSGGVRSCYPGLANGALRLLEAVETLDRPGRRAVVHSLDTVTGTVTEDVTVLVAEAV